MCKPQANAGLGSCMVASQSGCLQSRSSRTADAEALADEMRHMSIQRVIKSLTTMTNVCTQPCFHTQKLPGAVLVCCLAKCCMRA